MTLDDFDVLFAAAYLPGLGRLSPPWANDKLDHSDVAADIVDTILKGTGFPMAKIDAVRGAIRTHMFYRDPAGAEALYLHDADALDWLGAIGVARIFGLVDPNGGDPTGPKAVAMLEDNLRQGAGARALLGRPCTVAEAPGRAGTVPERPATRVGRYSHTLSALTPALSAAEQS